MGGAVFPPCYLPGANYGVGNEDIKELMLLNCGVGEDIIHKKRVTVFVISQEYDA